MKPTHFDFTVRDRGQARAFFEKVFGWGFEKFPMPYEYYRIQAGPEGEPAAEPGGLLFGMIHVDPGVT